MSATKKAIDFTNVQDGGAFRPKHKTPGEYKAKIVKVEDAEGKKSGDEQWVYTIVLTADARALYPYYCPLTEKSAWKIRKLLMAAGLAVPKKRVAVDPNKVVGREIGVTLDDDEYEGRMKSVITDTFPVSELEEDEPEEPPARSTKKSTSKKSRPADDEDEDDDLDDLDLEEV